MRLYAGRADRGGILRLDFRAKAPAAKEVASASAEARELTTLRETLAARLAILNGTPLPNPPPVRPAATPPVAVAVTDTPAPATPDRQSSDRQSSPQQTTRPVHQPSAWRRSTRADGAAPNRSPPD